MAVATKRPAGKRSSYERMLRSQRAALLRRLRDHRQVVLAELEPEDELELASRTLQQDLAVDTLEREKQLLGEIEAALGRFQTELYGVCAGCGANIPARRLQALPWTRFCLACAERRQAHWKN
ncbi:MAG: TraR/DksA family transcriptional regulator [Terriglobia bacterium]